MSVNETNPLAWLLAELPAYVHADALDDLLARFVVQKRRYARAVKINDLRRRRRYAEHRAQRMGTPSLNAQIYTAREQKLLAEQAADPLPERSKEL